MPAPQSRDAQKTGSQRLDTRSASGAECRSTMVDPAFAPAHVLAAAVRRRELPAVELMTATLERIARVNPILNAFVALRADDALADARALDQQITRGADPGPLAGIPFGVKDLED